MFEAAQKAYLDAGIEVTAIDSFVTCAEDLNEGISIFDEYTPDQLGAVQKPMHTLTADGLYGIADAVMQIRAGLAEVVVVEAHSKASNIETPEWLIDYALDPVFNRPLGLPAHVLPGLEMNYFLKATGVAPEACAEVAAKNRTNALSNPIAAYPVRLSRSDVTASPYLSYPLRELETARRGDGCVVVVVGSARRAGATSKPIWVRGVGFASDSPTLESRNWVDAECIRLAASRAYRQADIREADREIHLFEVDDSYAFKELQHLTALGVYPDAAAAARATEHGDTRAQGRMPTNVSGGALGLGTTLEASGLYRLAEVVLQLRGQAGPRQLPQVSVGLAQSWRGVPTTSGAVVVLSAQ